MNHDYVSSSFRALVALLVFPTLGLAQSSSLQLLNDDPRGVSSRIGTLNVGVSSFEDSGLLFEAQAHALVELLPTLEGSFDLNYGVGLRAGGALSVTPIALYRFSSKTKVERVKVILKHSEHTTYGVRTATKETNTTYLNADGRSELSYHARGGLRLRSFGVDADEIVGLPAGRGMQTSLIGGLEFRKTTYLLSSVDGRDGITSGILRGYVDAVFSPLSRLRGVNVVDFGVKAGGHVYINPNKHRGLRAYNAYAGMYAGFELGYAVRGKLFGGAHFGWMLYRNR